MNYILKAAVIALQIDSVNGGTVYFTDGSTLEVDDAFISQQMPLGGDYVLDGVTVMKRAEFEGMYCEEVELEPVDEDEVIGQLREELVMVNEILDGNILEIDDLKSRLVAAETDGGTPDGSEAPEPVVPSGDTVETDGINANEAGGSDPALV